MHSQRSTLFLRFPRSAPRLLLKVGLLLSLILLAAPLQAAEPTSGLLLGPIDGWTRHWHPAPATLTVPLGATLHFERAMLPGETVHWTGAAEVLNDGHRSVAQCPMNTLGPHVVEAAYRRADGRIHRFRCVLNVVALRPEEVRLSPVQVTFDPVEIPPELEGEALNRLTYEYFRSGSVAAVTPLGEDRYRTSVQRPLHFAVTVEPPEAAPLIEWVATPSMTRRPHARLGTSLEMAFRDPGNHIVEVGPWSPRQSSRRRVEVETYSVSITSHQSGWDLIAEGREVTFHARTFPQGLEEEITWLASTRYGSSDPVVGHGPSFTVRFEDTFGHPSPILGGPAQWLGVRADNGVFNQDQKAPGPDEKFGPNLPTGPNTELIPEVYIPLDELFPEMVLETSDPVLLDLMELGADTPTLPRPFRGYLGAVQGAVTGGDFDFRVDLTHPGVQDLLEDLGPDVMDRLTATELVILTEDENCNIVTFDKVTTAPLIETASDTKPEGGCCAILATAHSLVRKMGGIVREADAVEADASGKKLWKSDFLKKVWAATGDTDNNRGITDDQAEAGHEADWNQSWTVDQVDDDVELFDGDASDLECDTIEERCDVLIERLMTNDDITLRIRGKIGKKGDEWGHRVPVESAVFDDGPPCCCTLTITRTSRQEPTGKRDFEGIAFDPKTAEYKICEDGVTTDEFPGAMILRLVWDSFDETGANGSVKPTDQGEPGSALED
jgi:hypothetical protein